MSVDGDWRRPQDRKRYRLYWCASCDLGQLHPRPSQEEADAFYDIRYCTHVTDAEAARARAEGSLLERARIRLAWTVDRGSDLDAELLHRLVEGRPSDICDLGCGNGALMAALRERGHRVVGVEPDPVARRMALDRGLAVHAGHADAPPAAVKEAGFQVVVLSHVLHLCLDPVLVLANARKLLAPGGVLVCEVTNNACLGLRTSGDCWRWLDIPRHLTLFTSTSISRACEAAGLHVRSVAFGGYTRQFKREWLDDEAQKRAILHASEPPRPGLQSLRNWALLARSAFARPEAKYDSVRVVAEAGPR
jgi:SAM-dependent methyltransferase